MDKIKNKLNKKSDFDMLSNPHLKENPFSSPEGYFAQLEADLLETIKAENSTKEEPKRSKRILSPQLQTAFSMAAMFIIILGLGYSAMYITNTVTDSKITEQLATKIDEANIEQELTYEEISLYLGTNYTYEQEEVDPAENVEIKDIDKDALEDYIIDNYSSSISILASLE